MDIWVRVKYRTPFGAYNGLIGNDELCKDVKDGDRGFAMLEIYQLYRPPPSKLFGHLAQLHICPSTWSKKGQLDNL